MDRLSPLDASFLHVEDDVTHMHVGLISLFEGPPPSQEEFRRRLEAKLHLAPRYRQRVRFVPLGLGRPVWHDDPHFALDYHVRRTALPAPGGDAELRALVGRVMSHQLDRARPLWELWVVEGLADGRWALLTKLHHAMVDGVSGSALIALLLDDEREAQPAEPPPWMPAGEPGSAAFVAASLADRAKRPWAGLLAGAHALGAPRELAVQAAYTARGLAGYAGLVRAPEQSALNGPLGPHRRWAWARARLTDVKEIRRAVGAEVTVNDVVLAAIAGGLRTLLADAGEPVDRTVRTLVPVSVRADDAHGVPDNRVSAMFAELPLGIEDPVERLLAVSGQLRRLKASHEIDAGQALTALGGLAPEVGLSLGARIATRLPQRSVNTVTTNVPGPQRPLFLAGRRMLEALPYVPLGGHVRIGVAIYSYDGGLAFGVTGDADGVLEPLDLCRGIEFAMSELLARAHAMTAPKPRPRRSGRGGSLVRPE
jgi:diacylglycerol O-acyltransferase